MLGLWILCLAKKSEIWRKHHAEARPYYYYENRGKNILKFAFMSFFYPAQLCLLNRRAKWYFESYFYFYTKSLPASVCACFKITFEFFCGYKN